MGDTARDGGMEAEVRHPMMKGTSWERTDMMADLHVQTSHHGGLE